MLINKDVYKEESESDREDDEIINIRVKNGSNYQSNNHYEAEEENYHSLGAPPNRQSNQYTSRWYAEGNVPRGQDTITGLSDIKGATLTSEDGVDMNNFGGTISSLVNMMNSIKIGKGKEMYLLEREAMWHSDPLITTNVRKSTASPDEKLNPPHYHQSHYSSGNQTAYFNSEADLRNKHINHTLSRKSLEESKRPSLDNPMASKSNIHEELVDDPEDPEMPNSYSSPIKNYQTELYQIQEEMPYSSTSMVSDRKTEPNRGGYYKKDSIPTSTYYSLASHSENLNESFLL